jgi:hypothetical protein
MFPLRNRFPTKEARQEWKNQASHLEPKPI